MSPDDSADRVYALKSTRPDVPRFGMRLLLLAYLLFLFVGPLVQPTDTMEWAATLLSVPIFLGLYVATWIAIDERHQARAITLVCGLAGLGLALIPFNVGGNTYIVYAAAFAPFLLTPRSTIVFLIALIVIVTSVGITLPVAARWWVIVPTALLIITIGGGNLFYAEHQRRNALLFRAQEEVEEIATLAERERISRDLHDLLGHTLSVIALKSELASRIAATDPNRALQEVRDVERVSRDALAEVRAAVEGYRRLGIAGELQRARRALDSAGVRFEVTIADGVMSAPAPSGRRDPPLPRMSPRLESVMALALREAVTNVVRHSRARTCRVDVARKADHLTLRVSDDGAGGMIREGHGLTGMRERVAAAGGTMWIDTSGRGVTVSVTLPDSEAGPPSAAPALH